jgi:hypothetical protein
MSRVPTTRICGGPAAWESTASTTPAHPGLASAGCTTSCGMAWRGHPDHTPGHGGRENPSENPGRAVYRRRHARKQPPGERRGAPGEEGRPAVCQHGPSPWSFPAACPLPLGSPAFPIATAGEGTAMLRAMNAGATFRNAVSSSQESWSMIAITSRVPTHGEWRGHCITCLTSWIDGVVTGHTHRSRDKTIASVSQVTSIRAAASIPSVR